VTSSRCYFYSLKKNGDGIAAALWPDERTGLCSHLRRHDVLCLSRSWHAAVLWSVMLHAETNNTNRWHFLTLTTVMNIVTTYNLIELVRTCNNDNGNSTYSWWSIAADHKCSIFCTYGSTWFMIGPSRPNCLVSSKFAVKQSQFIVHRNVCSCFYRPRPIQ